MDKATTKIAEGIYGWFKRKGIRNKDVILETMASYLQKKGVVIHKDTKEEFLVKEISSSFQPFCSFAGTFLKENNYI